MKVLPKILTLAAASTILGVGAFATTPAAAGLYYDNGAVHRSGPIDNRDRQGFWFDGGPRTGDTGFYNNGYRDDAAFNNGYGFHDGYNGYRTWGYEVNPGAMAVCPSGYHIGPSNGLCWPN